VHVVQTVTWSADGRAVRIIDQRLLPRELVERELRTVEDVCDAIRTLAVRGAPAIGVAGAMGLVASLLPFGGEPVAGLRERLRDHAETIGAARPTAVNLRWALDRLVAAATASSETPELLDRIRREADAIRDEDRAMCERIGAHGAALLATGARVLTHCNAGALATAGIGTALAPVYVAARAGRTVHVYAGETRPLLQGSRLTAWELTRAGIPVTVLPDGAAAALLRTGNVDLVVVGADRIAANGDVANKIGTYALALAARYHDVPFYVAAPTSTLDPRTATGDQIPIEYRAPDELLGSSGTSSAAVFNPAFDVTPADLITGYITDRGVFADPESLLASLTRTSTSPSLA
jgi:methylthioribose-1-phosphate isomerase